MNPNLNSLEQMAAIVSLKNQFANNNKKVIKLQRHTSIEDVSCLHIAVLLYMGHRILWTSVEQNLPPSELCLRIHEYVSESEVYDQAERLNQ